MPLLMHPRRLISKSRRPMSKTITRPGTLPETPTIPKPKPSTVPERQPITPTPKPTIEPGTEPFPKPKPAPKINPLRPGPGITPAPENLRRKRFH